MTGDELYDEIQGLIEEAAKTAGAKVNADLRMVGRSLGLFTSNAAELRVRIEEEQRTETWLGLDQAQFEERMDEIDRLLHNFLAAAYSLSQITMKVRNAYADDDLTEAYAREAPFDEPLFQVVKRLRIEAQHVGLPVLLQRRGYKREPTPIFMCQVVVNRRYLETLELNVPTREYVAGLTEDPPLEMLVDTYTLRVEEFTRWFVGAVVELREEELRQTHELRRRASMLAEPMRRARSASIAARPRTAGRPPARPGRGAAGGGAS